jgi:hypothetical protein
MKLNYFIGIDISKNELDFAVVKDKKLLFHKEISNDPTRFELKSLTPEIIILSIELCGT